MENQPVLLTVETLIKDLQDFDQDAEVAVVMDTVPVTLPIGSIVRADAQHEDGSPKKYILMLVSPVDVKCALQIAKEHEDAHKKADELVLN